MPTEFTADDIAKMKVRVPDGYWDQRRSRNVPEKQIVVVHADTGWHDSTTNLDVEDPRRHRGAARYRIVTIAGISDPVMLSDGVGVAIPGGLSINLNTGALHHRKPEPPYISHTRRISEGLHSSMYPMMRFIDPAARGKYLHPRFTELKRCIRAIAKVAERRSKAVRAASERVIKGIPVRL